MSATNDLQEERTLHEQLTREHTELVQKHERMVKQHRNDMADVHDEMKREKAYANEQVGFILCVSCIAICRHASC